MTRRCRMGSVKPVRSPYPGLPSPSTIGRKQPFILQRKKEKDALHYIGIAADETHRCKDDPQNRYPLVEWGITEAQALQICYDRGFDWGGLYEIYHRCSCWCCPLQRIDELRKLRRHHPELWTRLRDMDDRARAMFGPGPLGQFKQNWSVARLEERFAREEAEST